MERKRISYWRNKPTWSVYDLVFLLRDIEPAALDTFDDLTRQQLDEDLQSWEAWAPGCPLMSSLELYPMTAPLPPGKLLAWAQTLDGIVIPESWQPMVLKEERTMPVQTLGPFTKEYPSVEDVKPTGSRERENLLLTIGALVLALVDRSGPKMGTVETPNISQAAITCIAYAGEASGMAPATVRQRITDGLKVLNNRS